MHLFRRLNKYFKIKLLFYNLVDLAADKVDILVDDLLVGFVDFGQREKADNSCNIKWDYYYFLLKLKTEMQEPNYLPKMTSVSPLNQEPT